MNKEKLINTIVPIFMVLCISIIPVMSIFNLGYIGEISKGIWAFKALGVVSYASIFYLYNKGKVANENADSWAIWYILSGLAIAFTQLCFIGFNL